MGPIPREARVSFADGKVFDAVNAVVGSEIPSQFPAKYRKGLTRSDLFNATISWTADDVTRTQKQFAIEMQAKPLEIFRDYINRGNVIFSTLVSHPAVPNPKRFLHCSVVLQRAVLISDPPRQTIYLRSYFHSAASADEFVNFVPRGGLRIVFASDTAWFPLRLTSVIDEPASFVTLDVLSRTALQSESVPKAFSVTKRGKVDLMGHTYDVTRLQAVLSKNEDWPDLNLKLK
ncbi:MAG TPA: hypothetical protein VER58_18735 [Thermoanaerobaculia bacterium]|nr:hypothetical protein [Thermoanaerobaculia bacterium]